MAIIPDPDDMRRMLDAAGIEKVKELFVNLEPAELVEHAIKNDEAVLTDTGALVAYTGNFTGRAPKDRYIVKDKKTENTIWWGDTNLPFDPEAFDVLHGQMTAFLADKQVYLRDAYAGADPGYRLNLRIYNTLAWHNLFCHNMFLRPDGESVENFEPDCTIICIPEFTADPQANGTRQGNFVLLNLTQRIVLIGGTAYAGEMKKSIFSVLNYLLPLEHSVLPMHCSANMGEEGDTAIFFGLSGTGKTTLSTDPKRKLIGDDEHGWTDNNVFNFEGGCYAKVGELKREHEPDIWEAIRFGAILENTRFFDSSRKVDFADMNITPNTRTAYPIHYISNIASPSMGEVPQNIFFLTADAFGVLPPISKLNTNQAMYHFISGYTAKVAGTEVGVNEPEATFSACFGEAFLPLHPTEYAKLFGKKIEQQAVQVWLINTGWTGGAYRVGSRIKLKYTRAMITAALEGNLDNVKYVEHEVFGFQIPTACPEVPSELLNPKLTWEDKQDYDRTAQKVARKFVENFKKYEDFATKEMLYGAPRID
ncbi:MAG TPA: phosphoenolpyruvate carboxykinase (ATP) [Cyclobacteriaceae bacterium]|nr:phosphoenolpyruvate carboxykinase (ATP) [Cyclobacteriaceae bacterium]